MPGFSQRAQLLFQQHRYDLAAADLRRAMVEDPDDAYPHALLALCLMHLEKPKDALAESAEAIRLSPDFGYAHYARAFVLMRQNKLKPAEAVIGEAIRLDSWNASYFHVLSLIRLELADWRGALQAAEQGLALQGDNLGCTNARARALIKLKRGAEAMQTIDSALAQEPDNAYSHANKGWMLLEAGDHRSALEHFREALRLDANMEWARQGLIVALKAHYGLYRVVLGYFLWMSRLPKNARLGVIAGLWVLARILSVFAKAFPALAPVFYCLEGAYLLFCITTWMADPLFNTLLRFNKFGRYALTRKQTVVSNWIASTLSAAVLSLLVYLFHRRPGWVVLGIGFLFVTYGVAITSRASQRSALILAASLTGMGALFVLYLAISAGL